MTTKSKKETKKTSSKKSTPAKSKDIVVAKPKVLAPATKAFAVLHSVKGDYIDISLLNVRLAFPNLAEPREDLKGDMKYGCTLIVDESDMQTVMAKITQAMKMIAKTSTKLPLSPKTKEHYETAIKLTRGEKIKGQYFRDGNLSMSSDGEIYNGFEDKFSMSVSTFAEETEAEGVYKYKIPVIFYDQNGDKIVDMSKVKSTFYAGCYVAARLTLAAYARPDKGAWGFSKYFSAIRFLRDGESLITRSEDFEDVDFSNFETDEETVANNDGTEPPDFGSFEDA